MKMPSLPGADEKIGVVRRSELSRRPIIVFSIAFFLLIFGVSALRSWLRDPLAFDALQLNRLASSLLGTAYFASMIVSLARRPAAPLAIYAGPILKRAVLAAVTIASARTIIDLNLGPADELGASLPQSGRWLMVWLGYYLAGCAIFLVLRSERLLVRQEANEMPLAPANGSDDAADALWVERRRERVRIPIELIEWVEAEGDYIRVHTADEDGGGTIRMTLTAAERMLAGVGFVRTHRSAICRGEAVVALGRSRSGALQARLRNGALVPVGRNHRDRIMALMKSPAATSG